MHMCTVHFILEGSEKRHSIDCDLRLTVEAMRESIASSWGFSLQNIAISFNGERRGGRRGRTKLKANLCSHRMLLIKTEASFVHRSQTIQF